MFAKLRRSFLLWAILVTLILGTIGGRFALLLSDLSRLRPGSDIDTDPVPAWAKWMDARSGVRVSSLFRRFNSVELRDLQDTRRFFRSAWWMRNVTTITVDYKHGQQQEILNALSQAHLQHVNDLAIYGFDLQTIDLSGLSSMEGLADLEITCDWAHSKQAKISDLSLPRNLLRLKCSGVELDLEHLDTIGQLSRLEELEIKVCRLDVDHLFRVLPTLPNLKSLRFLEVPVEKHVAVFKTCAALRHLDFSHCSLSLGSFLELSEQFEVYGASSDVPDGYDLERQARRNFLTPHPLGFSPLPCGFPKGTEVLTPTGRKAIQDVSEGDAVFCRSAAEASEVKTSPTVGVSTRDYDNPDPMLIKFGQHQLLITYDQPLYVEGKGWVLAGRVDCGDRLRGKDGPTPAITSVENIFERPVSNYYTTYVIRTEGNLPYFVSPPGADFTIWVP